MKLQTNVILESVTANTDGVEISVYCNRQRYKIHLTIDEARKLIKDVEASLPQENEPIKQEVSVGKPTMCALSPFTTYTSAISRVELEKAPGPHTPEKITENQNLEESWFKRFWKSLMDFMAPADRLF